MEFSFSLNLCHTAGATERRFRLQNDSIIGVSSSHDTGALLFHLSDCKYISDAALDQGIIQLSYVIGSSELPSNVVVLLSATDWRCILDGKTNTYTHSGL
jgi:hypothetical protein